MKRIFCFILTLIFIFSFFIPVKAQTTYNAAEYEASAKSFVDFLAKNDFKSAVSYFSEEVKKALPEDKLSQLWGSLIESLGPFEKQIDTKSEKSENFQMVFTKCKFKNQNIIIKTIFNNKIQIAGLWFLPDKEAYNYIQPDYVKMNSFTEKDVQIGKGEWVLPGTLTIPKSETPVPLVILVHGSGPNDKDETIGPNKPFKDIAWGLASNGIATLRYDKRTLVFANKITSSITVKEEVLDDVISAVEFAKNLKEIDANKIYIIGHSLGGMLIPKIAQLTPKTAGFIIMAGAALPLEDLILKQFKYIFLLDNKLSVEEKRQLDELGVQTAKVKDISLSSQTPSTELPLGIPADYWLDLRDYKPAFAAQNIKKPVLILQGERDYQVTLDDFELWKKALKDNKNVVFKLYPKLNHLFIEGEGNSTPMEYKTAGHVAGYVILDIVDWIKKN